MLRIAGPDISHLRRALPVAVVTLLVGWALAGTPAALGDAADCPSSGSKTLMLADGSNTTGGYGCGYLDNWTEHSIGGWATQFWSSYPALGYKYDYVCDHQTGDVDFIKVVTQGNFQTVDGKTVPVTPGSVTYTASNSATETRHWAVGVIWNTGNPHDGTLPAPGMPPQGNAIAYTKTCTSDTAGDVPSYVLYQSSVEAGSFPFGTSVVVGSPFAVGFTTQVVSQDTLPNGQPMVLQAQTTDGQGNLVWTNVGQTRTADTTTGALTPQGCIVDAGQSNCTLTQQGLSDVDSVAVSPDGTSAYAVSSDDSAIAWFARDPSTGALTPQSCIADAGSNRGCPSTTQGLGGAHAVAVSPDGTSVYTASTGDNAINWFARDPSTGALMPKSCVADAGSSTCPLQLQGLSDVRGIVVSPNGKMVYAVSGDDSAIASLTRDPSTGALTPKACIADATSNRGCASTTQGLGGATGVAISPDGNSVYVVDGGDDAIVQFAADPSTGALTPKGCIADAGQSNCSPTQQGLGGAIGVTVSPDGKSVYVVSTGDDAIVRFDRDPSTGALTGQGCVSDAGQSNCGPTQQGLGGATGVAVSPDGKSVYVASSGDGAIARLDRDPSTGSLTSHGCVSDAGESICDVVQEGLAGATGLALSANGKSLYAAATGDNAVTSFARSSPPPGQPTSDSGGGTLAFKPQAPGTYTLRIVYPGLNVAVPGRGYTPAVSDTFQMIATAPATSRQARVAAPWPAGGPVAVASQGAPPQRPTFPPVLGATETSSGGLATVNSRFVVPQEGDIPSSFGKIACPKGYALLNVEASSTGDSAPANGIGVGRSSSEGVTLTIAKGARGYGAMAQVLCRRSTARHVLRAHGFAYGTIRGDHIIVALGNRAALGGLGNDQIVVAGAGSSAVGGLGDDQIVLRAGKTSASGGLGDDILRSVAKRRTLLVGGPGHDRLIGSHGPTLINAIDGRGGDTVICHSAKNRVAADPGDRLIGPCTKATLR